MDGNQTQRNEKIKSDAVRHAGGALGLRARPPGAFLPGIRLVLDLTHELFEDIFEGNHPAGSTVLVNHHKKMLVGALKLPEKLMGRGWLHRRRGPGA